SSSPTRTTASVLRLHSSNDIGNAQGAPRLSAMVATRPMPRGSPAWKLRYILSAPNGSSPNTRQPGFRNLIAEATPAHKPPPPIGTITAYSSGSCSHNSHPNVAVPSAVVRPSNG